MLLNKLQILFTRRGASQMLMLKANRLLNHLVGSFGFQITRKVRPKKGNGMPHDCILPEATYAPWLSDQEFYSTYSNIKPYTLVDIYRCHELWSLVRETSHVAGDILEVGVWRGGTGVLMAQAAKKYSGDSTVYLCDTFTGVVKSGEQDDAYKGGEHSDTDENIVRGLLAENNLKNTKVLRGIFPEDTGHNIAEKRFKMCHIDVDVYQSGKDVLEWVWPRLEIGGVVVFDDYGFWLCSGITKLVNEQRGAMGRLVIHNLNGHGIVVKTL